MTDVTIDGIVLRATSVNDRGGWDAPEQKVEEGFNYDSLVGPEPIEADIEAWIPQDDYAELESLREGGDPFEASIGHVVIESAKLEDLDTLNEGRLMLVTDQSSAVPAYQVTITVKEVRTGQVETAEISIDTEAGAMGSDAAGVDSSNEYPSDEDGGSVEDETGGIVGTLSGVRESLSGVF